MYPLAQQLERAQQGLVQLEALLTLELLTLELLEQGQQHQESALVLLELYLSEQQFGSMEWPK